MLEDPPREKYTASPADSGNEGRPWLKANRKVGLRSYIHEKLDLASDQDELRSRAVLGTSRYSPGSSYHRKHKQGIQATTAVPILLTQKHERQKWGFLQATGGGNVL